MSTIGRYNGIAYFVVIGTGIGLNLLSLEVLLPVLYWGAWLLVVASLASMLDRAVTLLQRGRGSGSGG